MAFLKDWWFGSGQDPKEENEEKVVEEEEVSGEKQEDEEPHEGGPEAGALWNVKLDPQSLSKGVGGKLAVC